ncbi:MAG: energy transducer TonB [Pyrinomonadaceae bacterium]|nr:energy transducer TonB [Pyrinomonadaceae bacterium]
MMRTAVFLAVLLAVSVSASFGQETKLKIIEQPRPELPARHSTLDVQGTVGLRVEFREDGTIGEVSVVKHLTNELDQLAMKLFNIKFEPERRDGKPLPHER